MFTRLEPQWPNTATRPMFSHESLAGTVLKTGTYYLSKQLTSIVFDDSSPLQNI